MSESKRGITASIDIDALLKDTWLQVISLRHRSEFNEGEGRVLWERCVVDMERVRLALKKSGLDETNCHCIVTAVCALLDEVVTERGQRDDACVQWYNNPLQRHFFGSADIGDTLCDRMQDVLRQPTAEIAVLTCFQRVMTLGFLGHYRSLNDPERQELVTTLNERVTPYRVSLPPQRLVKRLPGHGRGRWLFFWTVNIGLSVLILAVLWWGLDHGLDQMSATLFPGGAK